MRRARNGPDQESRMLQDRNPKVLDNMLVQLVVSCAKSGNKGCFCTSSSTRTVRESARRQLTRANSQLRTGCLPSRGLFPRAFVGMCLSRAVGCVQDCLASGSRLLGSERYRQGRAKGGRGEVSKQTAYFCSMSSCFRFRFVDVRTPRRRSGFIRVGNRYGDGPERSQCAESAFGCRQSRHEGYA